MTLISNPVPIIKRCRDCLSTKKDTAGGGDAERDCHDYFLAAEFPLQAQGGRVVVVGGNYGNSGLEIKAAVEGML